MVGNLTDSDEDYYEDSLFFLFFWLFVYIVDVFVYFLFCGFYILLSGF